MASLTSGFGQFHTNEPGKVNRRPYAEIDLEGIRALTDNPQRVDKSEAQWLIPSSLPSRTFKQQEEQGQFHLLWADIDKDPPTLDDLHGKLCFEIIECIDHEIYTSRSARKDYQKSRILIPLDKPLSGADWLLCQKILNDKLEASDIVPDRRSEGCAQLCYLPNRGLFYDSRSSRDGVLFDPMDSWSTEIAEKRTQRAKAIAEAEKRKAEAKAKREARSHLNDGSPINAFNTAFSVGDILIQAGYDQDGNRDCYRHPQSESGSFSASVQNGRVHSLSSADPLYTDGSGVGAHDAFSAFTVLFHHGNQNKAIKDAGDNWLMIGGESWNRVKQREYQLERISVISDFKPVAEVANTGEIVEQSGWQFPEAIGADEWTMARSTPDCIVENYLFADVALMVATGGTGKTTLVLFEAIHIVLGLELYGLQVKKPGPVLIITAEDTREMLVARLRSICNELCLSVDQLEQVRCGVRISDLSGGGNKLTAVVGDVVCPNHLVQEVIHASKIQSPVLVVIDPAVSFGVGEARVNDAEQGLIEAARKIRSQLNCCVRYIHHVSKAAGKEGDVSQFASRGGTAFADGARMVTVMRGGFSPGEWQSLTGYRLGIDENALLMARPKLSYAPPQDHIYIVRDGYSFTRVMPRKADPIAELEAVNNQVWQLLTEELKNEHYHSQNTLAALGQIANLKRQQIRDAVRLLIASGRVEERPKLHTGKGGATKYLHPVELATVGGSPNNSGEATAKEHLCLAA